MEVTQYDTEMEEEAQETARTNARKTPRQALFTDTVSEMMKSHLSNHKMDLELLNDFTDFSREHCKPIDLFVRKQSEEEEDPSSSRRC